MTFLGCELNNQVVKNFTIEVLTNFQIHEASILRAIGKTLSPGLLKNSQNREAKTEYLNHLNHCFSLGVEYQSCSQFPKLHVYKISASLNIYNRSYALNTETLFRKPEV